ncbi:MAG: hypothetical protein HQ581_00520 [Planctomycetes bacterium]|nr:hypothetical protein [Planctomycetota bacterium]
MIKKLIVGGGLVLLLAMVVVGRDLGSYVKTTADCVGDAFQESVPIEFQVERAKRMIRDLDPEVRKAMHLIAKEEVELENLQKRIDRSKTGLAKDKSQLMRLQSDLATGESVLRYANCDYTAGEVETDLANRFERYKTADATRRSLEEIRQARETRLDAARHKLDGMLVSKRQLEVEVENLEAQLQMVGAAQATAEVNIDDSRLGRIRELVGDLRTRLEVQVRLAENQGSVRGEIPLDEPAVGNVAEDVAAYFAGETKDAELAVNE